MSVQERQRLFAVLGIIAIAVFLVTFSIFNSARPGGAVPEYVADEAWAGEQFQPDPLLDNGDVLRGAMKPKGSRTSGTNVRGERQPAINAADVPDSGATAGTQRREASSESSVAGEPLATGSVASRRGSLLTEFPAGGASGRTNDVRGDGTARLPLDSGAPGGGSGAMGGRHAQQPSLNASNDDEADSNATETIGDSDGAEPAVSSLLASRAPGGSNSGNSSGFEVQPDSGGNLEAPGNAGGGSGGAGNSGASNNGTAGGGNGGPQQSAPPVELPTSPSAPNFIDADPVDVLGTDLSSPDLLSTSSDQLFADIGDIGSIAPPAPPPTVPEPTSLLLLGTGLALAARRLKRGAARRNSARDETRAQIPG